MTDKPSNFLATIIEDDLASGKHKSIHTRFPPEPNGYLHIGHAKSICVNFGLAKQFGGSCNLRFDDTNPEKEEQQYINSIQEDVRWLGFEWQGEPKYASDYFQQLYDWALLLIENGDAYVCELTPEQMREYRGTLTEPGKNSPYRQRRVAENLDLFQRMKSGEFADGSMVLRAKIDMASPNINMRDPILYRIRKKTHHQTGDQWCIYPSYDYTHGQSDALEGITHSICTLEFEDHKPLYEWLLSKLPVPCQPKQYEFARLNVNYTVTSKRKLKKLVDEGVVNGWDDPRMPTIAGMRRRGVPAVALRTFAEMVGTSRAGGVVDLGMLEYAIREELNQNAPRAMAVLRPLEVVISNRPDDWQEQLSVSNHPQRPELGERKVAISQRLYIDQNDFNTDNSLSRKKFKRLVPGDYVRLRGGYIIKAESFTQDANGQVSQIVASLVEGSLGTDVEGVKPRGVIHWVCANSCIDAEIRLYDRLFNHETPDKGGDDFLQHVNPSSLQLVSTAKLEASLAQAAPETVFQFEREGYFVADRYLHQSDKPLFNMTIGLRDVWQSKA